ncbi:MAG: L-seryl-tRNA(Sec) selenium transferase [Chloroflexi bacterium]|nr:L-seryl-tRNA(Sec) selenium transferase [Chloroflexota bacterium]
MSDKQALLRRLPSVDSLLAQRAVHELTQIYGRGLVVEALRAQLADTRRELLESQRTDFRESALIDSIEQSLRRRHKTTLSPVINATGVIIHTNLGRALLSVSAQGAMASAARAYNTLEFDLETGARGSRLIHAARILRDLTGAEDALVVNNNASALILILSALAKGREVVISRGQLVEIGGGFRIPAIMRESGAALVEVGTTNRTRIDDYAEALNERSAMILRAHASNFKQIGFVQQPALTELTALARARGVLAVDDLGSGALIDTAPFGLDHEPTVQESVAAGADLVCFSGDKLLGGPQAGIIVGSASALAKLKSHPLARALRVDKLTYAAMIATLEHYRRGDALEQIPVWRMIACSLGDIRAQAESWSAQVGGSVISGESAVGGGSLPGTALPTALLAIDCASPQRALEQLRRADPPVIARIAENRVLLDPRTVLPEQEADLLQALQSIN